MRKTCLLIGVLLFFVSFTSVRTACAQQPSEPAKIEIGGQLSSLNFGPQVQSPFTPLRRSPEAGFGGRFSYNLTRHVALEAEGNFFPHTTFSPGHLVQGQFGLKAGRRFNRFGIFAKGRPGFLSFSQLFTQTGTVTEDFNGRILVFPILEPRRRNFFSMDVGAVLEFYPTHRILVRFDAGDTMIHVVKTPVDPFSGRQPSTGIAHMFQFSSGVGVRFLNPKPAKDDDSFRSHRARKFEAGVQFSSLTLKVFSETELPELGFEFSETQSAFGGRLTYNFIPSIGAEIQTDFFPADLESFANRRAGGHLLQIQAGTKVSASRITILKSEFCADHHLVAKWRHCFADHFFIGKRAIDLGGVKESNAALERSPNEFDALGFFSGRTISKAQTHAAESDR
ncbi:MAG: hypothetical protein QOG23_4721 [Blastocatellia bacterium]|jgi:hypothetical protein|nr:hypothetical protein [Blastocatellia bacterium]